MGRSRMASVIESRPVRKRLELWCESPAGCERASQKKARVRAVRMSSGGLSDAMDTIARMEIQRRNSISPSRVMASRTVNFDAKAQQRGIQIAQELVDERGIALEQVFGGLVGEVGGGHGFEQAEIK
jgi:hypothetical protein